MGRAGKIRVGLLATFSCGNSISDIFLAVAWSAGHACAPRQTTPPSGNNLTHATYPLVLALAIVGALVTFGLHVPGAYISIRDDEVFDLTRMMLFARISYSLVTCLPLIFLQFFLIANVGMPLNFFIIKYSMSVLSIFVSAWPLLRDVLDRYGLLWGPMREHPRGSVAVLWALFGALLPLFMALVMPMTYPSGFEMQHMTLLATKLQPGACVMPEPLGQNWTIFQSATVLPYQIEHSPTHNGGSADSASARASPFTYRLPFTTLSLAPVLADIRSFAVQQGYLWSTRHATPNQGSLFGQFKIQFLRSDGTSFDLEISSPVPYFVNSFQGTRSVLEDTYMEERLCLDTNPTATGSARVRACFLADCNPSFPWLQFGVRVKGHGLVCEPGI